MLVEAFFRIGQYLKLIPTGNRPLLKWNNYYYYYYYYHHHQSTWHCCQWVLWGMLYCVSTSKTPEILMCISANSNKYLWHDKQLCEKMFKKWCKTIVHLISEVESSVKWLWTQFMYSSWNSSAVYILSCPIIYYSPIAVCLTNNIKWQKHVHNQLSKCGVLL